MNIIKWAFISWIVAIVLLLGLSGKIARNNSHVHVFCTYGRVFVEFEEDGKRWGTMMLDMGGKPIPCNDEEELPMSNSVYLKDT